MKQSQAATQPSMPIQEKINRLTPGDDLKQQSAFFSTISESSAHCQASVAASDDDYRLELWLYQNLYAH